jgi:hypothetical protein
MTAIELGEQIVSILNAAPGKTLSTAEIHKKLGMPASAESNRVSRELQRLRNAKTVTMGADRGGQLWRLEKKS